MDRTQIFASTLPRRRAARAGTVYLSAPAPATRNS